MPHVPDRYRASASATAVFQRRFAARRMDSIFAAPNYLQRPLERWQITALGSFEISDRTEAYSTLAYTNNDNSYQQAADATRPSSPGQESGTLLIPSADNNPLFTQPLRDFFADNSAFFDPDNDGLFTVKNIAWQITELGHRNVAAITDA